MRRSRRGTCLKSRRGKRGGGVAPVTSRLLITSSCALVLATLPLALWGCAVDQIAMALSSPFLQNKRNTGEKYFLQEYLSVMNPSRDGSFNYSWPPQYPTIQAGDSRRCPFATGRYFVSRLLFVSFFLHVVWSFCYFVGHIVPHLAVFIRKSCTKNTI